MKSPARMLLPGTTSITLLLVALAALLLAGCGGDDGGNDGPSGKASTSASGDDGASDGGAGEEPPGEESEGGGGPKCDAGERPGSTGDKSWKQAPPYTLKQGATYLAKLETSAGAITVELLPEDGPCAVNNFVFLAKEGFYDGTPFHRILKDFMVQTGDPLGTGLGGPGYNIKNDEVDMGYERGVVAMANAGRDTGGSQFFLVHGENVQLPPDYSIFGKVTEGLEVLDKIAGTPVEDNGQGEVSKPSKPVELEKASITEQPAA